MTMAHALGDPAAPALLRNSELDAEAVRQARIDLAACFRMAARLGMHEGICNHFSLVVPGRDDLFLVNPYGWAFSDVTASRLLVCDYEGNVVAGEGVPEATASTPACTRTWRAPGRASTPTCRMQPAWPCSKARRCSGPGRAP
jgi:hypothetical protein